MGADHEEGGADAVASELGEDLIHIHGARPVVEGERHDPAGRVDAGDVISEELDELFEICDRLVVIAKGTLSPTKVTSETGVEEIGIWMSGMWPESEKRETTHVA